MVTPLSLLVAIIVFCVVASALMILLMILASPTPAWYRRLNFSSVVFGLFMVAFGIFQVSIARENERTHRVTHYRGAPVTPAQSYAAGIGLICLGTAAALSAWLHRNTTSNDS